MNARVRIRCGFTRFRSKPITQILLIRTKWCLEPRVFAIDISFEARSHVQPYPRKTMDHLTCSLCCAISIYLCSCSFSSSHCTRAAQSMTSWPVSSRALVVTRVPSRSHTQTLAVHHRYVSVHLFGAFGIVTCLLTILDMCICAFLYIWPHLAFVHLCIWPHTYALVHLCT